MPFAPSPVRHPFLRAAVATSAALCVAGLGVSTAVATPARTQPTASVTRVATSDLPDTGSSAIAAAGFAASLLATGQNPASSPRGVNVGCTPSSQHPYPVVLVNGTFEVMHDSFDYLGPRLADAGYCVYGYNYGADNPQDRVQATGPVVKSVGQLATEISTVTKQTGTSKVDLVGYSQGGLISEYYTKFGGASKVHSVTALAPTTHGTTLLGLGTLGREVPGALPALRANGCPACADQVVGSAVVRKLDNGPIAVKGIPYTVIDTKYEDVVTPAGSSFIREPGVVNEYVQSFDPTDVDEHVILPFNPTTGSLVLAALARAGSQD